MVCIGNTDQEKRGNPQITRVIRCLGLAYTFILKKKMALDDKLWPSCKSSNSEIKNVHHYRSSFTMPSPSIPIFHQDMLILILSFALSPLLQPQPCLSTMSSESVQSNLTKDFLVLYLQPKWFFLNDRVVRFNK